jgi:hypothetical protein
MSDDEAIEATFVPALLPAHVNVARSRTINRRHAPTAPGFAFSEAHPQWVVEAAFICYVRAARNVRAALRLLKEDWDAYAPMTPDPETGELTAPPYPETISPHTLYKWRRVYEWDTQANKWVAEMAPTLNMEQLATLYQGRGVGVRFWIDLLQGEYDHENPQLLAVKEKAANNMIVAGGLGIHGTMNRVAPVIRQTIQEALDIKAMTPQERAEYQRSLMVASKTDDKRRKR